MNIRTIFSLGVLAFSIVLSGCVSTGVQPQTIDTVSAAVRPVAKNVVNVVLTRNPRYDSALLALAAASDAALNGGTLTQENIRAFVQLFAAKYELDQTTTLYIASALDDLAQFYRDTYGKTVADVTDPNVRKILSAFSAGIRDGVSLAHAMAPAAAVSP